MSEYMDPEEALQSVAQFRVFESFHMVRDGAPCEVKRTAKERLFSWPWRPWVATKTVIPKVPREDVLVSDGSMFGSLVPCIVAHPETAHKIRRLLDLQRQCRGIDPMRVGLSALQGQALLRKAREIEKFLQ